MWDVPSRIETNVSVSAVLHIISVSRTSRSKGRALTSREIDGPQEAVPRGDRVVLCGPVVHETENKL